VLALAGPLLPVAAAAAKPTVPTLDVEGIHAGQKAVVKTVFAGDRVEEFDAEIVGVLHGGRVEGDMILARATSERVVRLGVAAGMSGSPVYVDGRLIGALSSGWNFSREPLFGITPIREMLEVLDQPTQAQPSGTAGPTGAEIVAPSGSSTRFREFRWDDGAAEPVASSAGPAPSARRALDTTGGMTPLRIPLACSGLDARALEPLGRELEALGFAVVPGGKAEAGGPTADALVPGAAVAVDVLRGDLLLSAIGTVTYRDGDRVLIFGHPFFQSGEVRLPLSTASITTVVASQMSSFKLANGITVYLQEERTSDEVAVEAVYRAGYIRDPKGKVQLAHLTEHMLMKCASGPYKAGETMSIVQDHKGMISAEAVADFIHVDYVVNIAKLDETLAIEASRLKELSCDEATLKAQQKDVVGEFEKVVKEGKGNIARVSLGALAQVAYYGQTTIPMESGVYKLTLDDVHKFHDTHYRPDDMALVLIGNFKKADAEALVRKHFESIPSRPAVPEPTFVINKNTKHEISEFESPS